MWNERKKKDILQYRNRYLSDDEKQAIYIKLQSQKQVGFNDVAKIVNLKNDNSEYLNGLNIKAKLKGCETAISIKKILTDFQTDDTLVENIWQAIYDNVHEGSEYDENSKRVQSIMSALPKQLDSGIRIELALKLAQKLKFQRKYASLSKKAIEKILPLMQLNPKNVSEEIKAKFDNIKNLIETGEIVDNILPQDYIIDFVKDNPQAIEHGGLMYAFAASLVYGRHTKEVVKPQITNYHDIQYVKRNLRNPIVEQIANETMQVVKAIWKQYGLNPNELEIRVELARDLKNSARERNKIYKAQTRNKKINDKIKDKLTELDIPITDLNILKYKLYEQQKFLSPYTNEPIEISKLFDEKFYNIDHIIPKSRFFDDSISNKVICESNINEEKDNRTAWEYILQQNSEYKKNKDGYEILPPEQYLTHINGNFTGQKKKNLLAEKIPSNPVNRQLKDTQYISIAIKDELAKIVGSENVKTTTGGVTDYLRSHWGLKKLFMELTEPRFRQMELWNLDENGNPKESWTTKYVDTENNKHIYEIKGWSKRYDHRHHAIDALVVALSNDKFVKRLNDLNKYFQDELKKHIDVNDGEPLEEAFFNLEKKKRDEIMKNMESSRKFETPMTNLVSEVKKNLKTMVVSQKPKDKLAIKDSDGKKQLKIRAALHQETYYGKTNSRDTKTVSISELKAKNISQIIDDVLKKEIDSHRKKYDTMKEAFSGEGLIAFNESRFQTKNKSKLKPPVYKVKLWYSKNNSDESDLQRLYDNNPNKSVITGDNYMFVIMEKDGKRTFDIATLYDSVALAKEEIKEKHYDLECIKRKICEAKRLEDKKDKKGNVIPKADKVLFYLQQNDLVYMPNSVEDEVLSLNAEELKTYLSNHENKKDFAKRIYKVVKFTGKDCFFIPNNYAKEISIPKDISEEEMKKLKEKYPDKKIPKQELNYAEFSSYGNCVKFVPNKKFVMNIIDKNNPKPRKIQDYCIKIKTDWLGNVIEFNGQKL